MRRRKLPAAPPAYASADVAEGIRKGVGIQRGLMAAAAGAAHRLAVGDLDFPEASSHYITGSRPAGTCDIS